MTILFVILIVVVSVVLSLIVLIQNPKGGGLSGTFGGISSQFMGVKQTTDVLEKGTWIFSGLIGLLCLFSAFFISGTATAKGVDNTEKTRSAPVPASSQPAPNTLNMGGDTLPK
jgi:preprotein translocase subunit SecG